MGNRPYLPNPQPWVRGPAGGAEFVSLHDHCRPEAHPGKPVCPDRSFVSYGQWWQAHQPIDGAPAEPKLRTISTSYWPYGQQITVITGSDRCDDMYKLDGRLIHKAAPHVVARSRSSPVFRAAADTAVKYAHSNQLVEERGFRVKGIAESRETTMAAVPAETAQKQMTASTSGASFLKTQSSLGSHMDHQTFAGKHSGVHIKRDRGGHLRGSPLADVHG